LSAVEDCLVELKLSIEKRNVKEALNAVYEADRSGQPFDASIVVDSIGGCLFGIQNDAKVVYDQDNKLLGIEKLTADDIRQIITQLVK
jgi:hypothetical protein